MNKSLQIRYLKRYFGADSDLIDFDSHVDGRLSYEENKKILIAKAKRKGINKKSKLRFKGEPIYWFDKAESFNALRNPKARAKDGVSRAKRTFNNRTLTAEQFYMWKRNPRRYDILGVDSRGTYDPQYGRKQKKLTLADISKIDIL